MSEDKRGDEAPDFHTLFEAAPGAYLVLKPDAPRFTIVAATDAYLQRTLTRRAEILGRALFEVFPDNPDEPHATGVENLRGSLERVIANGEPDTIAAQKYDIRRPDGRFEVRYWSTVNTPVFDASGTLRWVLLREQDVTDFTREKQNGQAQRRAAEVEASRARELEAANAGLEEANARLRQMQALNEVARVRARTAERTATRIVESITDAFVSIDTQWRFTYVNTRAEELFGHTREELLGRELWRDYSRDSPFGRVFLEAMSTQRTIVLEAFSEILGRRLEVHANPSPDALSVFIHDVTDRHEAQEALRESERRFRSLFDESMDAVLLTRPDGTICLANRASTRMFGYSESELKALGRDAVLVSDDPRVEPFFEKRRRAGRARAELTVKRKDGTRFPVELSSALFLDERGEEWTSMFIRDVSERKAQEAEREELVARLEGERRWLRAVVDTSPVGLLMFEPDGRISSNEYSEKLFGMKLAKQGGSAQYAHKVLYPDGTPVPPEKLVSFRAIRHGETIVGESFLIESTPGKRVPVLGGAAPIRDSEGGILGAIVVIQDVRELKDVEAALRDSIRAREEILGIVAHDLRNPLGSILLQVEAIERRPEDEKRRDKGLVAIRRHVTRMRRLIQDLLDVSQVETGTLSLCFAPVRPMVLLAEVVEEQESLAAAASLRLRLETRGALPDVRADRHRLLQVFENLIGNALKFTKEGGRVTLGAAVRGNEVVFWVSDTGEGISADSLSHLFSPFWQADPQDRRGVGLGLPIVKGIVEASGGRIWAESRKGVGSTFFFTLPIASGQDADRGLGSHP